MMSVVQEKGLEIYDAPTMLLGAQRQTNVTVVAAGTRQKTRLPAHQELLYVPKVQRIPGPVSAPNLPTIIGSWCPRDFYYFFYLEALFSSLYPFLVYIYFLEIYIKL